MMRIMMKSKIHRATVTQADLDYVGSVTIDADLLDAADLLEGEQVAIVDITNGARIETYVIPAERGSGVIGINGAAAHLVHPGDLVITHELRGADRRGGAGAEAARGPRRRAQPRREARQRPRRAGARIEPEARRLHRAPNSAGSCSRHGGGM